MIARLHDATIADDEAERAALDCLLHGATDEALDPAHWHDAGRRALCLALDCLRWCGPLHTPATSHPRDCAITRRRNAKAAADAVLRAGIWQTVGSPHHELLIECWGMAGGHPYLLRYWLERLERAHRLRQAHDVGESLIRAAVRGDVLRLREVLSC